MKHGKLWARLLAAVCVLALVLPTISSAFAASYPYDVISMEDVNMRSRANTTSMVLKKIKAGDTVSILGVSDDFYRVRFDGKTGYAMKAFIDGTDPAADKPLDPSRAMLPPLAVYNYPYDTVVLQNVKLRKTAEAEGTVLRMLPEGCMVEVLDRTSNGFAKVKFEGKTGYVVDTHINLADIPAPTPIPTATPVPGSELYVELARGSSGTAVSALQSALAELGYLDQEKVDGKFGAATESALKTFQKRNGRTQDGVASADLQAFLYTGTPKDYRGYRQYVKTVAPIPGALIRKDGKGEAVTRLQTRLKELGYYTGELSGVFDDLTMAAFKMFEGRNGLNADGEASTEDQNVLFGATAIDANVQVTPTPAPTLPPPTRTLRRGDSGEDVMSVQNRLQELGYYQDQINGNYNAATVEAVKAFQKKSSLKVDGVLGAITRTVLYGRYAIAAQPTPVPVGTVLPDHDYEPITRENVVIIRSGSTGDVVLRLQTRLQELGYYISRLDGVYLTDDIEAVRAFQSANGLKVDGKAGFDTQTCLYSDNPVPGNMNVTGGQESTTATLRYGDFGDDVVTLQKRLITLGYLTGSADGKYGKNTKAAVKAFQKNNDLDADGVAGALTLNALYADSAKDNKLSTTTTLRIGTISEAVADMQTRLIALGYLNGKADGNFGTKTSLALIAFQKANGLKADGIAGAKTLGKLNAITVPPEEQAETTPPPAPSVSTISASQVRYANWYTEVRAKARLYPNATIYDFTTGISWQVNMFSLGAHADAEPITKEDTANMLRAFGGVNTWTPKAVWVVLSDGTVYMASTHDYEHDVQHNLNNNFKGHVCIHFPRTQAQVERIGPYATRHQKAIDLGWEATLQRAR
ncbi:MAG: peptidoglycan-binding protein [Clostridia bacterium]|nr:peptidoglycan-binding protein [Clostridia bacterium]